GLRILGTNPRGTELTVFDKALQKAWERRSDLRGHATAFRLLNGAASGTPGLIVDMFGEYLIVYAYDKDMRSLYGEFEEILAKVTGAKGIALKDRSERGEEGREEGRKLFGTVPETAEVREGPLRFRVHLQHPRNVGLFLDTRLLRESLITSCRRHDVLNLFSYSCSLGLAAAYGNSGSVVNVDISGRYLGWGKENLTLNGIAADKTKFVTMDSEKYLDWAAKKAQTYDVIILDPPSFSRSKGAVFTFDEDYFRLLGKGVKLLRPGGRIYALTNYGGVTPDQFKRGLVETLEASGATGATLKRLTLPEDFDGAGDAGKDGQGAANASASVEGTLLAFEATLPNAVNPPL
ncbi:MAG: class SAM-dependent rRNA methyltransferase, partial [Fibrobacteres bacterium]|nr:class SAM-dependent rRNA methyltransferase [Fibrobacterota bacterium]